jgi:hypothetical protein
MLRSISGSGTQRDIIIILRMAGSILEHRGVDFISLQLMGIHQQSKPGHRVRH